MHLKPGDDAIESDRGGRRGGFCAWEARGWSSRSVIVFALESGLPLSSFDLLLPVSLLATSRLLSVLYSSGASPHKKRLKCDISISPSRLITHLLYQIVHHRTTLHGNGQ